METRVALLWSCISFYGFLRWSTVCYCNFTKKIVEDIKIALLTINCITRWEAIVLKFCFTYFDQYYTMIKIFLIVEIIQYARYLYKEMLYINDTACKLIKNIEFCINITVQIFFKRIINESLGCVYLFIIWKKVTTFDEICFQYYHQKYGR